MKNAMKNAMKNGLLRTISCVLAAMLILTTFAVPSMAEERLSMRFNVPKAGGEFKASWNAIEGAERYEYTGK